MSTEGYGWNRRRWVLVTAIISSGLTLGAWWAIAACFGGDGISSFPPNARVSRDVQGRVIKASWETAEGEQVELFQYDEHGRLIQQARLAGMVGQSKPIVTTFTYDAQGRLVSPGRAMGAWDYFVTALRRFWSTVVGGKSTSRSAPSPADNGGP